MPLPIIEMPMYPVPEPARLPIQGFTLLEHGYNMTESVYLQMPEQVILHLVARMLHLSDGPRRVAELSDALNAKIAELTKTRMMTLP